MDLWPPFYLNSWAVWTSGFLKRMEMPRFMNGFVKSITVSLAIENTVIFNWKINYMKTPPPVDAAKR